MFSFEKGKNIAYVKGGEYDGKYLKIFEQDDNKDEEKENKNYKKFKSMGLSDDEIDELFKKHKINIKSGFKELEINDGELIPIPDEDAERECAFVAGISGAGKSTWSAKFIKLLKIMHGDIPLFIFSAKEEDPSIDNYVKGKRILLNEEIIDDPIPIEEFICENGSIVLFDDALDDNDNAKINKEMKLLSQKLLRLGRDKGINVIITKHELTDYHKTRVFLNECRYITFFKNGSANIFKNFLKNYIGLDNKEIDKILKLKSKWITVHKNYPKYILHSKGGIIIS